MNYCPNCKCRQCAAVGRSHAARSLAAVQKQARNSAAQLLYLNGATKARVAEILGVPLSQLHTSYRSLRDRAVVDANVRIASLDPHEQRLYRAGALPVERSYCYDAEWITAPLPPDTWPVTRR